jgi:long-chain acyl-CoA synthetase
MEIPYDARPWLRFYPEGVPAEVDVPAVPVTQLLDDAAASFPRRRAVAFLGWTTTYRHLVRDVDRFAGALRGLGVHRGDRVALIMPNCPQQVIAFYAVLRRGAVVVQHNPLYTASELQYQLADSGARVAIVLDRMYPTLAAARRGTDVEHVVVTSLMEYLPASKRLALKLPVEKAAEAREELEAEVPEEAPVLFFQDLLRNAKSQHHQVPVDPTRDLAALQYTGGTTGRPKGAKLTHYNLVANAHQVRAWDPRVQPGNEVGLGVLPLFHVFGLTLCLATCVLVGGTLVLVPKFDLDLVFSAIRRWKPTIFPGVPPIYQQISESSRARSVRLDSIRTCVSGAMTLPRQTVDQFRRVTGGARLVQGYGLTEASPVVMANPLDGNARHISVGLPFPNTDVRIVDENDPRRTVPIGQAGELIVRGPQVFAGYWNQPKETDEVLVNGWLRTGDIGMMSPDGFFTLIDRKRDVIISDGFNIYPSEVEEVLNAHPAVKDCAIIGVPDERRGEVVKAYVVPSPGYEPTAKELSRFCQRRLTGYKVPSLIEFRDDLPRNMIGKVLRRVLRQEHEQGQARPSPAQPAPGG